MSADLLADKIEKFSTQTLLTRDELQIIVAALRAVPSPGTVGVREASCANARAGEAPWRTKKVYHCADCERQDGNHTWPIYDATGRKLSIHYLDETTARLIVRAVNALALSPTHCTSARREEIAQLLAQFDGHFWENITDNHKNIYRNRTDAILSLSEQSGPTAGSEA